MMNNRRKPRWVLYQENQEARKAAQRDSMKNPAAVISARVRGSDEYKQALAAIEAAVNAFYNRDETDEELVTRLRAACGRTAIRRQIIAECGAVQVHQSEMFGYAPISAFINHEDVQNFESRALRARQEQKAEAQVK